MCLKIFLFRRLFFVSCCRCCHRLFRRHRHRGDQLKKSYSKLLVERETSKWSRMIIFSWHNFRFELLDDDKGYQTGVGKTRSRVGLGHEQARSKTNAEAGAGQERGRSRAELIKFLKHKKD